MGPSFATNGKHREHCGNIKFITSNQIVLDDIREQNLVIQRLDLVVPGHRNVLVKRFPIFETVRMTLARDPEQCFMRVGAKHRSQDLAPRILLPNSGSQDLLASIWQAKASSQDLAARIR